MKTSTERKNFPSTKLLVVFAVGFFALAAQTLMFRSFLTVYEGNELGVGAFFSSWLVWVCIGAIAGRFMAGTFPALRRRFDLLPPLYVPAFLLQQYLVLHSRALAHIAPYEMFPFTKMFPVSLVANAPVSFVTGLLFVLACEWTATDRDLPVAWVYMLEALGSFTGGVLVTLGLAYGMTSERIFLLSSFLLFTPLVYCWGRQRRAAFIVLALALPLLFSGVDRRWAGRNNRSAWRRILPADAYRGSFTTSQATYLFGEYSGQFNVLAWESVAETIPNAEYASEVVALSVAQKPDAQRVLVIGPGSFAICKRFLLLPQLERVTWLHSDPEYPERLLAALPAHFKQGIDRLEIAPVDARRFLDAAEARYDLVLFTLPDATTLVLNRYFTREFFSLLKEHIGPAGVLCVRVAGGENYMGTELVNLGASLYATLAEVFGRVVLKPGDETWFVASDQAALSSSADVLRDRFSAVNGAEAIFPPVGLLSLYLEDRADFQLNNYREAVARAPQGYLVNTDRRPRAMLHALLFIGRHAGAAFGLADRIELLAYRGFPFFLGLIALAGVLRLLSRLAAPRPCAEGALPPFDSQFLVFSTGATGLSLSMVLMFMFQARHGSIYLHIGLISSLYMFGLFCGSSACERLIVRGHRQPTRLLQLALAAHLALVFLVSRLPPGLARLHYAWLFLVCGAAGGLYVPLAAESLCRQDYPERAAGAVLGAADNLGGAAGGLVTGLVLLPVFGSGPTLGILAALLAVNLLPLVPARTGALRNRRAVVNLAYVLAAVVLVIVAERLLSRREPPVAPGAVVEESAAPLTAGETARVTSGRKQGKPRVADEKKIRRMIEEKQLSDREALYYEKLGTQRE
ncbi:MAG: hypothetical protein JXB04_00620 [Kiritimatiellae bacterium]|nr:hypothetical protein [Kiritimatiellia bacterium]